MIISEKQIMHLMNIARFVTLNCMSTDVFRQEVRKLIEEIENQQSEELRTIE